MKDKRRNKILLLILLILGISIGYAALATTLKINGTTHVGGNVWDVHWANVGDIQKSNATTVTTAAAVDQSDNTKVGFNVSLNEPGDYYEFQVDAVNAGTLDAMVGIVSQATVPDYVNLTMTYADGSEIEQNQLLPKANSSTTPATPSTERIKVKVEFSRDIDEDDLETIGDGKSINIVIYIPYGQADDNAVSRPKNLDDISWSTIVANIQTNPKSYAVGSTKAIDLDINGNGEIDDNEHFHARIVNTSKPAECSTEGFSQTACGVVVEFEEILFKEKYNNSWTNAGGYPATNLYNNYLKNNSTNWIYNLLPQELQAGIIDTYTVSGHEYDSTVFSGGNRPTGVYESTDKIYLLSAAEVWESGYDYDSASNYTRQIDYYKNLGVKIVQGDNTAAMGAVKKFNGTDDYWWLRTARPDSSSAFYRITTIGAWNGDGAADSTGVSPAFRIGTQQ